jgi:hypothetical protein
VDVVGRVVTDLLHIRNCTAVARDRECWKKEIGEAMARTRAEVPNNNNNNI